MRTSTRWSRELRSGASFFYSVTGDRSEAAAAAFAGRWTNSMRAHAGTNRRLAVDKIMLHGLRALEKWGFEVMEGEEVTEKTRAIKGPDEILARCAAPTTPARRRSPRWRRSPAKTSRQGGVSEDAIWAELHAGNIRRGGEWIETRLLASGPRTNPWFQECGPRIVQHERDRRLRHRPDRRLRHLHRHQPHLVDRRWAPRPCDGVGLPPRRSTTSATTQARLRPGVTIDELTTGGHQLAAGVLASRSTPARCTASACATNGPTSPTPTAGCGRLRRGELEPGMTLCVEALISPEGGDFSIKLEDQVLITETGCETLTRYPLDARLAGG